MRYFCRLSFLLWNLEQCIYSLLNSDLLYCRPIPNSVFSLAAQSPSSHRGHLTTITVAYRRHLARYPASLTFHLSPISPVGARRLCAGSGQVHPADRQRRHHGDEGQEHRHHQDPHLSGPDGRQLPGPLVAGYPALYITAGAGSADRDRSQAGETGPAAARKAGGWRRTWVPLPGEYRL